MVGRNSNIVILCLYAFVLSFKEIKRWKKEHLPYRAKNPRGGLTPPGGSRRNGFGERSAEVREPTSTRKKAMAASWTPR
jgi:hypothetical protein